jgi:hypothetical protein
MKGDTPRARVAVLSLIVGAYAAACAADAGDPVKVEGGATTAVTVEPDGGFVGYDAPAASDVSVHADAMYVGNDGNSGSDGPGAMAESSVPQDVGTTILDVGVGAGCAAGAVVIVLMPSASQNANSGNFNTAGPVCVELMGSVHQGWGLSNGQGRTLTLTSAAGTSAPIDASAYSSLPVAPQAGSDGFVYWNFSADDAGVNYTSVYIF